MKTGLVQPWTSIGLDAPEMSLDGPAFSPHTHPRAFGSMPRFLGYYVRDQHLLPIETAIRKITSLPAQREHLEGRGLLKPGFFADITFFDPATIIDHATYTKPDQLSTGVDYVIVNGQLEYDGGKLTGIRRDAPFEAAVISHPPLTVSLQKSFLLTTNEVVGG
ncbi:MAG: amidohydrolase family protein [Candidatus Sulfotelmatobacter sp.]